MREKRSEQVQRADERENREQRINELTARLDALSLEQDRLRREIDSLRKEENTERVSTKLRDRNSEILHIGDIVFVITKSSRTVRFHRVDKAVVTGVSRNKRRVLLACSLDPTNTSNRDSRNVRLWTEQDRLRYDARQPGKHASK